MRHLVSACGPFARTEAHSHREPRAPKRIALLGLLLAACSTGPQLDLGDVYVPNIQKCSVLDPCVAGTFGGSLTDSMSCVYDKAPPQQMTTSETASITTALSSGDGGGSGVTWQGSSPPWLANCGTMPTQFKGLTATGFNADITRYACPGGYLTITGGMLSRDGTSLTVSVTTTSTITGMFAGTCTSKVTGTLMGQ